MNTFVPAKTVKRPRNYQKQIVSPVIVLISQLQIVKNVTLVSEQVTVCFVFFGEGILSFILIPRDPVWE